MNNSTGKIFVFSCRGDAKYWSQKIESSLRAREVLVDTLSGASTAALVIGQQFLPRLDLTTGGRELTAHALIRQALASSIKVVPILVDGARMPGNQELPVDIRKLSFNNALSVTTDSDLPGVIARLVSAGRMASSGSRDTARVPQGKSVFISYRRDDSGFWARELARSLSLQLGSAAVYLDVGSGLPGLDFWRQIQETLAACTDVAVMVGPGFLERNAKGLRRIDDPRDYVRREIETAKTLGKIIHVVLAGKSTMPKRGDFPREISFLVDCTPHLKLVDKSDADGVARQIVEKGLPAFMRSGRSKVLTPLVRPGTPAYASRAMSIIKALSEHGWNVAGVSQGDKKEFMLVNGGFPDYRMRLPVDQAEVILEEKSTGLLKLWIQRSIFPISPHQLDDLDLLRLSDRLLEAALDPGQYLNRVGRINLSLSPPPISMDEAFRMVRTGARQNVYALEAYLRTKRKASMGRLSMERQIKLPNQLKARAIAFTPQGNALVVATDGGAAIVRLQDWKTSWLRSRGSYDAVDVSTRGDIAIASFDGRIAIWGNGGGLIADSVSPYAWMKRLGSACPLKKVVWSPVGNMLVCFGEDAVWMYAPVTGRFSRWNYPVEWKWNREYGGRFTSNGRELVVFANGRHVWVVDANDWKVRGGFDAAGISGSKNDRLSLEHQPVVEPTFDMINEIDVGPRGDILACAGYDGQIMLYDLKTLRTTRLLVGHNPIDGQGFPTSVQQIKFSPDGRWLASAGTDDRMVVWDANTWEPAYGADLPGVIFFDVTRAIAWSADSTRLFGCGGEEGTIHVWRL